MQEITRFIRANLFERHLLFVLNFWFIYFWSDLIEKKQLVI